MAPRCGTTYGYQKGCRCDACRAVWNADCKKRREDALARGWQRPGRPVVGRMCDECGAEVKSNAGRAADGLVLCREHRQAKRNRDERSRARRRRFQSLVEKAAQGVPANPRWPFIQGSCWNCGEQFTRRGAASPFCSKECSRRHKPRGRDWKISQAERLAIYERDGWACQICGDPVSSEADPLSDWGASLDHIVPRSQGGTHEASNLRLAHRWCNSVRGDLSYYSDTDLRLEVVA